MDMGPNREENLKDSFVRMPRLSGETQFTTSTLDVNGYVGAVANTQSAGVSKSYG